MRSPGLYPAGLLRVHAEPRPGWFLLSLPLLLLALDGSPDPRSAMLRLAVVLLIGMAAWGMGRGPAGVLAERGLAALLLVAWFVVCGTAFRLHGVPASVPARLAVTLALLLGPVALLWAWRCRARMAPVVDDVGAAAAPGSAGRLLRGLAVAVAAPFLLDRLLGLQHADLLVIGTALMLFATFRVQGRHQGLGALG